MNTCINWLFCDLFLYWMMDSSVEEAAKKKLNGDEADKFPSFWASTELWCELLNRRCATSPAWVCSSLCVWEQNQTWDRECENFHRHASSKRNVNSLASALRSRALQTVKYSFRHGLPSFSDIRYQVSPKNAPSLQWRDQTDASRWHQV